MTQEEKELLRRDLCARLFCGLIVEATYKDGDGWKTEDRKLLGVYEDGQVYIDCVYTNIENVKPYLRPMSSITDEEKHLVEVYKALFKEGVNFIDEGVTFISDLYNKNHLDYRGLIPKGLALEAPEGMYNN